MAALYGTLQGSRGETTRTGTSHIQAHLKTWEGEIDTHLRKDGAYDVRVREINSGSWITVCRGYLPGHVDPNAPTLPVKKAPRKRATPRVKIPRLFGTTGDLIATLVED